MPAEGPQRRTLLLQRTLSRHPHGRPFVNRHQQAPFLPQRRWLWPALLVSLLLHLLAITAITRGLGMGPVRDDEAIRARLIQVVRFEPQPLAASRQTAARGRQMEPWPGGAGPRPLEVAESLTFWPSALQSLPAPRSAQAARSALPGRYEVATRPDTYSADYGAGAFAATAGGALGAARAARDAARSESLDLLRVHDLARGRERAVVLIDPDLRRGITGFVNLTRLNLRGVGGGRSGLDALARHMRDHTDLLVQVRNLGADDVSDPDLMKDPVHFLIQGGGMPPIGDWPLLQLNEEEKAFFERYMRSGGLLFFEGSYRFLGEASTFLRERLGADAGIRPLPASDPLYSAFYTFESGFPGENKRQWAYLANLPRSWAYPALQRPEPVAAVVPANLDPTLVETGTEPDKLGLWGVALGDTLVAVLSDLGLHDSWVTAMSQEDGVAIDGAPALYAGTNLIVHSLTRRGTTARQRALPAWVKRRPRVAAIDLSPGDSSLAAPGASDPALDDVLDASLAVVRAPLGTPLGRGGVTVRVDGRYTVELLRQTRHGVVLHNLPPGQHWVELVHDGATEGVGVDLRGGTVTTMVFDVSRLAMLRRLRLRVQAEQIAADAWRRTFSDLDIEEVFLGEDGSLLAPLD